MTKILTKFLSAVFVILIAVCVGRAQEGVHPGVELYRSANYVSAISALSSAVGTKEFKANAEMWNYLGLAYMATKDNKSAVKSFEKAAKLDAAKSAYRTNLANAQFSLGKFAEAISESEKAIAIDPSNVTANNIHGFASFQLGKFDIAEKDADRALRLDRTNTSAYVLKSHAVLERLSKRLVGVSDSTKEAAFLLSTRDLLTAGKDLCKNNPDHNLVDREYAFVSAFYSYLLEPVEETTSVPPVPEPNVTPLKILSKTPASYTDSARQSNVQGTIKAAVLFDADGTVSYVQLLSRLGDGLDESVIRAARGIIFEPKTRNGKPVSVVKIVEYSFSIF